MLPRAHCQFCLSEAGQAGGFNVELIAVEVGSSGWIDTTQLFELGTVLGVSHKGTSLCLLASLEHQSWSHTKYSAVETFIILSPIPTILPLSVCIPFVTQFLLWCNVSYVLAILRRYIPPNKEVYQQTIPSLLALVNGEVLLPDGQGEENTALTLTNSPIHSLPSPLPLSHSMDDAIRCSVKLNNSRCEGTYYRSSADDSSELLCVNGIYSSLC